MDDLVLLKPELIGIGGSIKIAYIYIYIAKNSREIDFSFHKLNFNHNFKISHNIKYLKQARYFHLIA